MSATWETDGVKFTVRCSSSASEAAPPSRVKHCWRGAQRQKNQETGELSSGNRRVQRGFALSVCALYLSPAATRTNIPLATALTFPTVRSLSHDENVLFRGVHVSIYTQGFFHIQILSRSQRSVDMRESHTDLVTGQPIARSRASTITMKLVTPPISRRSYFS